MDNKRIMFRPNEFEENRLIELTKWIEKSKNEKIYPNYIINHILYQIDDSWEEIEYREKLCTKDIESTKKDLIDEFYAFGMFSEFLKLKLEDIREKIHLDTYEYFTRKVEYSIFYCYIGSNLYVAEEISEQKYERGANDFVKFVLKFDEIYKQLYLWIETLEPNENIDKEDIEFLKSNRTNVLDHLYRYRLSENLLMAIQDELLKDSARAKRRAKFLSQISNSQNKTFLYPDQEHFYCTLEKWASQIINPYCRKWISRYLERGRELPFKEIRVFKFKKDIERAKQFLLDRYDRKLGEYVAKQQERKKKEERYIKRMIRRAEKELEKDGFYDCEMAEYPPYRKDENPYPLGYAGSWAQDVEGYSDDDIDTIFDGDPSAYWNID